MIFLNPFTLQELREFKRALLRSQYVSWANGVEEHQPLINKVSQVISEMDAKEMEGVASETI